jgi:hypothetical protein
MREAVRRSATAGSLVVLCLFVTLGCGGGSSTQSNTLRGTATFPELLGGGPVANSRFVVLDLNQSGVPVIAQGMSDAFGNWAVQEARGLTLAVVFQASDNHQRVRVSGLSKPSETGSEKPLTGQTDIACEAGISAVLQGLVAGSQVDKNLILRLEAAAELSMNDTNFRDSAAVTAAALEVRRRVLGR